MFFLYGIDLVFNLFKKPKTYILKGAYIYVHIRCFYRFYVQIGIVVVYLMHSANVCSAELLMDEN